MLEFAATIWVARELFGFALLFLVFWFIGFFAIVKKIKQLRCSHVRYFETRSCDAICSDCRKNLGFIGNVQEQRAAKTK